MDTLNWVLVAAIIITNAANVLAGAFWGKQVIKAKDERIKGMEGQLNAERILKDERIKGMEDLLRVTEALLKDSRDMNDVKFRENDGLRKILWNSNEEDALNRITEAITPVAQQHVVLLSMILVAVLMLQVDNALNAAVARDGP